MRIELERDQNGRLRKHVVGELYRFPVGRAPTESLEALERLLSEITPENIPIPTEDVPLLKRIHAKPVFVQGAGWTLVSDMMLEAPEPDLGDALTNARRAMAALGCSSSTWYHRDKAKRLVEDLEARQAKKEGRQPLKDQYGPFRAGLKTWPERLAAGRAYKVALITGATAISGIYAKMTAPGASSLDLYRFVMRQAQQG